MCPLSTISINCFSKRKNLLISKLRGFILSLFNEPDINDEFHAIDIKVIDKHHIIR